MRSQTRYRTDWRSERRPCTLGLALWLAPLAACGSVTPTGDAEQIQPDAATEEPSVDGGEPERRCDPDSPFAEPTRVAELSLPGETFFARLSPDQLTMFLSNNGTNGGNHDLHVSTRLAIDDPFGAPVPIGPVNTTSLESSPTVTDDGLTIYFTSTRPGGLGSTDIYAASRATPAAVFGTPSLVANINSVAADDSVYVTSDGSALVIDSARDGGGADLFMTQLDPTRAFGAMEPLRPLNSAEAAEMFPVMAFDGLSILFARCPIGGAHQDCEIFRATRSSVADEFGPPTQLADVNSDAFDAPTWLSADGCDVYFSSNRDGPVAIYRASRDGQRSVR